MCIPIYTWYIYIYIRIRDLTRGKRRRIRKGRRRRRRRRRSAHKTIDKSVSTARIPIAGSYAARLTRCLYRGMYNNRLRRWHRCPFVSVGGHLGFSSRGRIREAGPRKGRRGDETRNCLGCATFEKEVEKKIRTCMKKNWEDDVSIGIGDQFWYFVRDTKILEFERILKDFYFFPHREKEFSPDHARMQRWARSDQRRVHGERRDGSPSTSAFMICLHGSPSMRWEPAHRGRPASTTVPNSDPRLIVVGSRSPITRSTRYHTLYRQRQRFNNIFRHSLVRNNIRSRKKSQTLEKIYSQRISKNLLLLE